MNKAELHPVRQMQFQNDYSSDEEDLQPLRIKRRQSRHVASSSPKIILDEEEDIQPLKKLQPRGSPSSDKRVTGSLLKTPSALSNESPVEGKCELAYGGSCPTGMKEEHNLQMLEVEDFFSDDNDFSDVEPPPPSDDDELLFDYIGWTYVPCEDSKPQMCRIALNGQSYEKSDFVKLLKEIDCENRFVACSVECSFVFFAELNKEEVDKLKGVEGVFNVSMFQPPFFTHR